MARWQDKLTKKELEHVRKWAGGTLASIRKTRIAQAVDKEVRGGQEPCWDCRVIAKKLGLE